MATVNHTVENLKSFNDRFVHIITWASLAQGDDGQSYEMPGSSDRSVQIVGTFGGATVTIEGSIDGTNWATLTDPQGNAISKTATALEMVSEVTRYIRPNITGGDGTTALTVSLIAKKVH